MAEYIERAAAVKVVLRERKPTNSVAQNRMLSTIQRDLLTMCAADVAPVVRCRDCKHLRPEVDAYTQETVGYWCAELDIGSVDVDGFCNRGERKETDHE